MAEYESKLLARWQDHRREMNERGNIIWGWVLAICLLFLAAALVLPLFARSSNCGGNSAALSASRSVAVALEEVAIDRGDKPFRVANLNATERENFRFIHGMSWLPGARLLVTSEQISISHGQFRKIIAVCDKAYDNVPQRRFGRSPMTHAVAYSDGSVGLIPVADYQRSDFSLFLDVMTFAPKVEPSAASPGQPVRSETNQTSSAAGRGRSP